MMRGGHEPVDHVQAPLGVLAWCTSAGWLTDPADVVAASDAGDVVFHVGVDRTVRIRGTAMLSALALVDKRVLTMRRELSEHGDLSESIAAIGADLSALRDALLDITEHATDRLTRRQ